MSKNSSGSNFKKQFADNPQLKRISIIILAVIVLIGGYVAYHQLVVVPGEEKAADAYYEGLNYASKDSTDAAIEALTPQVKKYDGYKGGEIAQYTLGRQYMAKGEFKKALKELEDVDLNDTYNSILVVGLQGDCQSELKKYKEALDLYEEAAGMDENDFTTPMFLFKAAVVAEELKDWAKAKENYEKIRDNYKMYYDQHQIEKYLARASNRK